MFFTCSTVSDSKNLAAQMKFFKIDSRLAISTKWTPLRVYPSFHQFSSPFLPFFFLPFVTSLSSLPLLSFSLSFSPRFPRLMEHRGILGGCVIWSTHGSLNKVSPRQKFYEVCPGRGCRHRCEWSSR